ncbi:MAG: hypothetical protein JW888_17125 [Pirellulales bacterium]|nr:hypothetical protein [Pirellulales bacterium]
MTDKLTRRRFAVGVAAAVFAGPRMLAGAEKGPADQWGDLVGQFIYDGVAPPRKKLKVDKDVDCCGKYDIRDESAMVGKDGGLANVYVYVRDRRIDVCPELEASVKKDVVLDNRDCIFMPHCLKIWVSKQSLQIVNSDPVAQNVAFSPLHGAAANIVLPPPPDKAAKATWKFEYAERKPVPIACNYHPWESAFILPLAHPYVDISRADGTFRIAKLPPGEVELQLWHERVGYLDTPKWKRGRLRVTIVPGKNDLGTIRLAPSLLSKEV